MFITLFLVSVAMELGVFQSFSEILEPITTILGLESGITLLTSPRESILLGKILFISTIGLLQATVILLIAAALGVRIHNPINIILVYVTSFLFGVLFSAIATTLALFISDHDGMRL